MELLFKEVYVNICVKMNVYNCIGGVVGSIQVFLFLLVMLLIETCLKNASACLDHNMCRKCNLVKIITISISITK